MANERNWAGNYTYGASELYVPDNVEQIQELVARSDNVKVIGTRHSFNGIADTEGSHLSLAKLNRIVGLDRENSTVTVEAGIRYGELCSYLHDNGYALHNLASLPHISVAGACATATHGSGDGNASLSAAVREMELVAANGETVNLRRGDPDGSFEGAVVGLGGLGVVTKLTLDLVPAFEVSQVVYENLPLAKLEPHVDAIYASGYSVSLFTNWQDAAINQVWVKRKLMDGAAAVSIEPELYGAKLATSPLHPVPGHPAHNCSEQMGVPGPWHERLAHFKMEFTPSAGEELQSEYFVPREQVYEAIAALADLRKRIAPLLFVSEVRTIAADELWMSPCYMQRSAGIHFTWKRDWEAVRQVLPLIESKLEPFKARPHWAKLFTMEPSQVQAHYRMLPQFRELLARFDPEGKFRNAFLNRYIW
ncbi:FAD-binding protein [Cohnella sp. LGH]|uniref:FAD-binding protein n=1 Tax=Cohnella sp. LGH TaxID=1619153 RepID=UPI001ADA6A5D|nr:FAD-binding protein [Cohnella sp. LGH]QTH45036.1 FAD-binding protein [Cohnella sp. LGH]